MATKPDKFTLKPKQIRMAQKLADPGFTGDDNGTMRRNRRSPHHLLRLDGARKVQGIPSGFN